MFDKHRALASSLPDAIAAATPDKVQELVALLVERVETADTRVSRVTWVPAARPFSGTEGPSGTRTVRCCGAPGEPRRRRTPRRIRWLGTPLSA